MGDVRGDRPVRGGRRRLRLARHPVPRRGARRRGRLPVGLPGPGGRLRAGGDLLPAGPAADPGRRPEAPDQPPALCPHHLGPDAAGRVHRGRDGADRPGHRRGRDGPAPDHRRPGVGRDRLDPGGPAARRGRDLPDRPQHGLPQRRGRLPAGPAAPAAPAGGASRHRVRQLPAPRMGGRGPAVPGGLRRPRRRPPRGGAAATDPGDRGPARGRAGGGPGRAHPLPPRRRDPTDARGPAGLVRAGDARR